MISLKSKHLKTGEELEHQEILELIDFAIELKRRRKAGEVLHLLPGKHLALIFDKPSLRTRFSFTVGMSELGGSSVESILATRKHEEPEDLIRVLAGYCSAVMVRTHSDLMIDRMISVSPVPVLNGLSELHHPCQILADLMTLSEVYGKLKGLTLSYVGDGNNILHSLLLLAPAVGMNIRFSCPKEYQPHPLILKNAERRNLEFGTHMISCASPQVAVLGSQGVYTDVWTSMGFEEEKAKRDQAFAGYQVNEELMGHAAPGAVVMHCLPMERGKEISVTLPDSSSSVIFQQSENRLHIQKALLVGFLRGPK